MSLLRKIPTILGAGGGSVPEWRQHLQPCEYLETDGNCFITIPFKPPFDNFEIKLEKNSIVGGLFGARNGINSKYYLLSNNNGFSFEQGNTSKSIVTNENKVIFKQIGNNLSLLDFGNNVIENWTYNLPTINYYLVLFGVNLNPPATNQNGLKIWYSKCEFFNLYSCYVKSGQTFTDNKGNLCGSGVAGMVDTLTGIFYTNDGTGTFSHGADIADINI